VKLHYIHVGAIYVAEGFPSPIGDATRMERYALALALKTAKKVKAQNNSFSKRIEAIYC
jgi:hypothetical protein